MPIIHQKSHALIIWACLPSTSAYLPCVVITTLRHYLSVVLIPLCLLRRNLMDASIEKFSYHLMLTRSYIREIPESPALLYVMLVSLAYIIIYK